MRAGYDVFALEGREYPAARAVPGAGVRDVAWWLTARLGSA